MVTELNIPVANAQDAMATLTPLQALINLADFCNEVFQKPAENCDLIAAKNAIAKALLSEMAS